MQGGSSSTQCRLLVSYSKLAEQFFVVTQNCPGFNFSLPLRYELAEKSFFIDYQVLNHKCHFDIKSLFYDFS